MHEYGGGEYDVRDGVVVFSELSDGRLRVITDGRPAYAITPEDDLRYGDVRVHPDRNLVLAVREDHRGGGEPVNTIVALDLDGDNADGGRVLCSGADFYSTPELSRVRPVGVDRMEPPEHALGLDDDHGGRSGRSPRRAGSTRRGRTR